MADYQKLTITGVYSKSSDLSDPKVRFSPDAFQLTPDEYIHANVEAATSAGTTITTSFLSSATLLVIKNNSQANYVTATFDCAGMGSTDTSIRIAPFGFYVSTDFTPAQNLKLVANSAACMCEVYILGT